MRKRRWGYMLLAALVVSGIAGTPGNDTLSKAERKVAINYFKDSRARVIKATKGLSEEQLNFKASPDSWSIKECAYHIALSENNLWTWFEGLVKSPANPGKRSEIKVTDEQVYQMVESRERKVKTMEPFEPKNAKWANLQLALDEFKQARNNHIQYARTTTETLRDHVTDTPLGAIDAYQLLLFISAHTNRHVAQMEEVKAAAGFPMK